MLAMAITTKHLAKAEAASRMSTDLPTSGRGTGRMRCPRGHAKHVAATTEP